MSWGRSDSVAVMLFAVEASDDGSAEAEPRSVFLFILPRRGRSGRSPCTRDRRCVGPFLGPRGARAPLLCVRPAVDRSIADDSNADRGLYVRDPLGAVALS